MSNLRPRTRQVLAYGSLVGLVLVSVAWVLLLWFDKNPEGLTPVLATWTGITSSAVTFYFATSDQDGGQLATGEGSD